MLKLSDLFFVCSTYLPSEPKYGKMEIVTQESVEIPCSVVVSGLTETDSDEEVSTYLQRYGSIKRFLRIDDPKSDFHRHIIVEFTNSSAMESLEPLLPLKLQNPAQTKAVFEVKSLASVYASDARSRATRTYMEQLCDIARLSGSSVEQMLKEELAHLASSTVGTLPPSPQFQPESSPQQSPVSKSKPIDQVSVSSPPRPLSVHHDAGQLHTPSIPIKNLTDLNWSPTPPVITCSTTQSTIDVNPPNIQRVVVEHVVRSSDSPSHLVAPGRLRAFSGKYPRPNNEADYNTWRTSVEVLMKDPSVSDSHCAHRILDSLLPPASEMTKHLGPQAKPSAYLQLLDSVYGTVEDGDELYARFMSTLQNDGEKPSAFLQRLHVALSTTMRRGGVSAPDFDQQLLKQFCRGCWENSLIADLQLEQKKKNPPSFAELLLLLRTEEDKQAVKMSRMKQHLGSVKPAFGVSKPRVMSHLQMAHSKTDSEYNTEVEMLKKQVADISAQLSSMTVESQKHKLPKQKTKTFVSSDKVEAHPVTTKGASQQSPAVKVSSKPRPWYCFQCGEDGHVASACDNEPNPSLVAAKKKQLRERQAMWEASNSHGNQAHLN